MSGSKTMKYKQQSAENEGGEMEKNQQIMATVEAVGDQIQTQQSTEQIDIDEFERVRRVRLVGVGGDHQKQHNNQPKWR